MMGKPSLKPNLRIEDEAETRRQLLQAGTAVFDEVGLRTATVREICQRASANIAAIHYHFGDKETLYAEVLRYSIREAREKYSPTGGVTPGATPEKRLRAFIRATLLCIFDAGPHACRSRLLLREMIDPTAALDDIVQKEFRPVVEELFAIVRQFLGPKATAPTVRRAGFSVVSQVMFYHHCRPVVTRLFPEMKLGLAQSEELADHITNFSVAALRGLALRKPGR